MLAEAMIALTIAVGASSAILLAIEESVSRSLAEEDRQYGRALAEVLFAEMELMAWNEPGATVDEWPLAAEAGEISGYSRAGVDDLGDWQLLSAWCLCDRYAKNFGRGNYVGGERPVALRTASQNAAGLNFYVQMRYVSEYNFWDAVSSPTRVRHAMVVVRSSTAPYDEVDRYQRWFVKPSGT